MLRTSKWTLRLETINNPPKKWLAQNSQGLQSPHCYPQYFLITFTFNNKLCLSGYVHVQWIEHESNEIHQGMSPPSPYLTCFYLVFMLHINILLSFHWKHIFEGIIFNIEDNVWFRFGGDAYRFLSFCFVLFNCVKKIKKKKNCLAWGLCFEFVILLLLKE